MIKHIGITQRVMNLSRIKERRDVLDQRWMNFAKRIGVLLIPLPNIREDIISYANELKLHGLIFSGGNDIGHIPECKENTLARNNDVAHERDETEHILLKWANEKKNPLSGYVGVCNSFSLFTAVNSV